MKSEYQEISDLFSQYELLYDKDPNLALKKMVDLYPNADKTFNHEVTDAIELWIEENMNSELISYLQSVMGEHKNIDRVYTSWISFYKQKTD